MKRKTAGKGFSCPIYKPAGWTRCVRDSHRPEDLGRTVSTRTSFGPPLRGLVATDPACVFVKARWIVVSLLRILLVSVLWIFHVAASIAKHILLSTSRSRINHHHTKTTQQLYLPKPVRQPDNLGKSLKGLESSFSRAQRLDGGPGARRSHWMWPSK